MIRCKNCGWENPAGTKKCKKCNARLTGSMAGQESETRNERHEKSNYSDDSFNSTEKENCITCCACGYELAKGMKKCPRCGEPVQNARDTHDSKSSGANSQKCAKCGTELSPDANFCHKCGQEIRGKQQTENPWSNPKQHVFFTLKRITWPNEVISYEPVPYSGQTVILNRSNTDPNNYTITSKEQARITYENDSWFLEDLSVQETTLLQVRRKIKLEPGDKIILGNRTFEFKG